MWKEIGFSIIELLVVTAIFGILALIAIPQYSTYRQRGYTTMAAKDLRDIAAAEEQFFAKNGSYHPISHCALQDPSSRCEIKDLPGVMALSRGISLSISPLPNGFTGMARHVKSDTTCLWDSTKGGMLGCSKM